MLVRPGQDVMKKKQETDNQEQNNKIVYDTISFWNSHGL